MKKFASILALALISAFILTACGEDEAYKLYADMNAAMEGVASVQAKADAKVGIEAGGENIDMSMMMDIKEIIHSETDIEMSMLMSIEMGELGAMDVEMYFKDGWMYQDVMDMKTKTALSLEEAMKQASAISSLDFEKEAISKSEVTSVGNGKQLSFTLRGDKLGGVLNDMAGFLLDSFGGGMDMNLTFGDVDYTIVLDSQNLPLEQRIIFSMEMQVGSETAKASYDMNITDFSYNDLTEIDYPADFDSYTEM